MNKRCKEKEITFNQQIEKWIQDDCNKKREIQENSVKLEVLPPYYYYENIGTPFHFNCFNSINMDSTQDDFYLQLQPEYLTFISMNQNI